MDIYKQSLSRDEKNSIILSVLIATLGYLIELFTCCDVFTRTGAIIVCVGVYFGAKGFTLRSSKISSITDKRINEIIEIGLKILDSRKDSVPDSLVEESKLKFLNKSKEIEEKSLRSVYALEMRLIRVESGIIMVGTLVWAFGDLAVLNIYISCAHC